METAYEILSIYFGKEMAKYLKGTFCFMVQRVGEEQVAHPIMVFCPGVSTPCRVAGKERLPSPAGGSWTGKRDLFATSHLYSSLRNPRTRPHNDLFFVQFAYK